MEQKKIVETKSSSNFTTRLNRSSSLPPRIKKPPQAVYFPGSFKSVLVKDSVEPPVLRKPERLKTEDHLENSCLKLGSASRVPVWRVSAVFNLLGRQGSTFKTVSLLWHSSVKPSSSVGELPQPDRRLRQPLSKKCYFHCTLQFYAIYSSRVIHATSSNNRLWVSAEKPLLRHGNFCFAFHKRIPMQQCKINPKNYYFQKEIPLSPEYINYIIVPNDFVLEERRKIARELNIPVITWDFFQLLS